MSPHIKGDSVNLEEPKSCPHFKGISSSRGCYSLSRRVISSAAQGLTQRRSYIQLAAMRGPWTLPRGPNSAAWDEDVAVYREWWPHAVPTCFLLTNSQEALSQSAPSIMSALQVVSPLFPSAHGQVHLDSFDSWASGLWLTL